MPQRDCSTCRAVFINECMGERTCKCNKDPLDRRGKGYYGWCHPDKCHGSEHPYIIVHGNIVVFLDEK